MYSPTQTGEIFERFVKIGAGAGLGCVFADIPNVSLIDFPEIQRVSWIRNVRVDLRLTSGR